MLNAKSTQPQVAEEHHNQLLRDSLKRVKWDPRVVPRKTELVKDSDGIVPNRQTSRGDEQRV